MADPRHDAAVAATRMGVIDDARARQRGARRAGASAAIAAVALAIVIASGVGGGARASGPRSPGPVTLVSCTSGTTTRLSGTPSRALLSIVAVLRRPATSADALAPGFTPQFAAGVYVRYVRLARVVGGIRYYLLAVRDGRCGHEASHDGLAYLAMHVPLAPGFYGGSGGGGEDAAQIEAGRGLALGPPGSSTSCTLVQTVPDGVGAARVTLPAGPANGFHKGVISPAVTLMAPVSGNLLVMRLPRSSGTATRGARIQWLGADGHVTRTITTR